ncbi:MAG: Fe-S-containing hydro-lyase [Firmicutes bacterium]|jgi:fumarate hydratase subunit beta|nr:Fe-S-containing hydro-lyase [Bacillota bacterium]
MDRVKQVTTPLSGGVLEELRAGDRVLLSGEVYTARDAAHRRLVELMEAGRALPVDLRDRVIYYVGPCPAKPGQPIGSCGPTTSGRMDTYTPRLLEAGLKGMIGKGVRKPTVVEAIRRWRAVYFIAVGGAGALLAKRVLSAQVVAFPELGPEAIFRLEVEDFPVIVGIDTRGEDVYASAVAHYRISASRTQG